MRQEVRVMLQLTLDVDSQLSRTEISEKISKISFSGGMTTMMIDIIEIKEEAEIYGNE